MHPLCLILQVHQDIEQVVKRHNKFSNHVHQQYDDDPAKFSTLWFMDVPGVFPLDSKMFAKNLNYVTTLYKRRLNLPTSDLQCENGHAFLFFLHCPYYCYLYFLMYTYIINKMTQNQILSFFKEAGFVGLHFRGEGNSVEITFNQFF